LGSFFFTLGLKAIKVISGVLAFITRQERIKSLAKSIIIKATQLPLVRSAIVGVEYINVTVEDDQKDALTFFTNSKGLTVLDK
jgi:hypothetical protein